MDLLLRGDWLGFLGFLIIISFAIIVLVALYKGKFNIYFLVDFFRKTIPKLNSSVKIVIKSKAQGIIFGKAYGFFLAVSDCKSEGHIGVLCGSGIGKTSSILIPTLQSWTSDNNNSSFVIDISGDIEKNIKTNNKLVFDVDNPTTIPYDVFSSIDKLMDKDEQIEALQQLGILLRPITQADIKSGGGKYYAEGAQCIIQAMLITGYFHGADFCQICEMICSCTQQQIISDINNVGETDAIKIITPYTAETDLVDGCYNAARKAVRLFATNKKIKNCVRRPNIKEKSFSPSEIEHTNCFIKLPHNRLKLYEPLTHIIVAQTLDFFMSRPLDYDKQLLFALDEMASLGKLELLEALRTYRKCGVRIMLITQSNADIDLIYSKEERTSMINNFKYKVILSAEDTESQKFYADLIGKETKADDYSSREQYIIKPEKLGRLRDKLVLIYPEGHMVLKKNYYFKRSIGERIVDRIKCYLKSEVL